VGANLGPNIDEETQVESFENRVLGKIFGARKDEVTGEWRRLKNENFYDQYYSSNISQIKKNEMGRTCGRYGGDDMGIQGYRGETRGKETVWKT
jgi:hypothetical protein